MHKKVSKLLGLVSTMSITIGTIELLLVGGVGLVLGLLSLISPAWHKLGTQEVLTSILPFAARLPLAVAAIVTGTLIRSGSRLWVRGAVAIGVLAVAQFCFDTFTVSKMNDDLLDMAILTDRVFCVALLLALATAYFQAEPIGLRALFPSANPRS